MISTSNFRRCGDDPKAVAISVGIPKGWKGKRYYKLAPRWDMLKMTDEEYDRAYREKLSRLDARSIYEEIKRWFGEDAVLLCYEAPNVRCHRRLVAEWFEKELGVTVTEHGFERNKILKYSDMTNEAPKIDKKIEEKQVYNVDLFGNMY